MPSGRTPPNTTSSTRMRVGAPGARNSANPSSMCASSRPFQPVNPGGGVRSVPPYHSIHPKGCGPKSSPESATSAEDTTRSDSTPCTIPSWLARTISIIGPMKR